MLTWMRCGHRCRDNVKVSSRLDRLWVYLALGVCLVPLILMAITGFSSRFLQDDYCYVTRLGGGSFLSNQIQSYLHETTFAGNRYSLSLGMGLAGFLGTWSARILPGLMIILWLGGVYAAFRKLNLPIYRWLTALVAIVLLIMTLSTAPNLTQVLYWRPGMFPYLGPLVAGSWLLVVMLGRSTVWKWLGIFLLSWLGAGFSETGAAFQMVWLTGFLGLAIFLHPIKKSLWKNGLASVLGTLAGIILLLASPANAARLQASYVQAAGCFPALKLAVGSVAHFLAYSAYRVTLPTIFVMLFFFWLAFIMRPATIIPWKKIGWIAGGIIFSEFFLLLAVMFPSAYAESSYPADRSLMVARWGLTLSLAGLGWLAGWSVLGLSQRSRKAMTSTAAGITTILFMLYWIPGGIRWLEPVFPEIRTWLLSHPVVLVIGLISGVLVFGLFLYLESHWVFRRLVLILLSLLLIQPVVISGRVLSQRPAFQQRATLWDWRDAQIRAQAASGVEQVTIPALDSLAGIAELQSEPGHWVNRCAADYYGIKSLQAVEPILQEIPR
jgi:hypothetical protein